MQEALEAVTLAPEIAAELDPSSQAGFATIADPVLPIAAGRFKVLGLLGAGGMGTVYAAEDTALGRTVALKMIRAFRFASTAEQQRFEREARATAKLDHPHIVPVYEVGELEGHAFLVMKLITGGTLADRLPVGAMRPDEAVGIMAKMAAAVQHAHEQGVLHRDLKPSNILLDEAGQPWLTDFGMARMNEGDSELTLNTAQLGTPHYMSPEQAAGRAREVSTASDVWALGAMLYQLLSGKPPYTGETHLEIMHHVTSEPPPRLMPRTVRERDLALLIERCLQKEPADRLTSAGLLADDLERWLRGEAVSIKPLRKGKSWWWASAPLLPVLTIIGFNLSIHPAEKTVADQLLTPPSELTSAVFGRSVAIDGDTMVVGAPMQGAGTALVYAHEGGRWRLQATLSADQGMAGDEFGRDVALHGNTLVVGAHLEDTTARDAGAVYVFNREGTAWKQTAYLKAAAPNKMDGFGRAVAVHGDTIVVGSRLEDGANMRDAGAAYVFVRQGLSWVQQARLVSPQPGPLHLFGMDVDVEGNTLIVGADGEGALDMPRHYYNVMQPSVGGAYVFTRSGSDWTLQSRLAPTQKGCGGCFGYSVALSGDTALIGAYRDNNSAATAQPDLEARESGAAFVFLREGHEWRQQAYLKASNLGAGHRLGFNVALDGDAAVIGAYAENRDASGALLPEAGAAYVFQRRGAAWTQTAYLKASTPTPLGHFGMAVGITGRTLVVGALGKRVAPFGPGQVWMYRLP